MARNLRLIAGTRSELGEGPIWHPLRSQLFWFAITECQLHACDEDGGNRRIWTFDDMVSAAGWIDEDSLLIASEQGLWRFDIESGRRVLVTDLEAGRKDTRSNDGRADRAGGFWIGTTGKTAREHAGAIYRYRDGALSVQLDDMTIPNAICFAPDGSRAYCCDTPTRRILQWRLEPETGETIGEPELFADLSEEKLNPDGAVIDSEGCLWNAQWGAGRVARYDPEGRFMEAVEFPISRVSCPAFGGADMKTLYVTTAWQGMGPQQRLAEPDAGSVFACDVDVAGLEEAAVSLATA